MKYPDSVITKNQKGDIEVRRLVRRGEFVEYDYIDPDTGLQKEKGKRKIVLRSGKHIDSYFIIPLKDGRDLLIKDKARKEVMIWDGKKSVKLWG